jgi:hypothetical protein
MTLDIDRDQSAVGYTLPRVVTIVGGAGFVTLGVWGWSIRSRSAALPRFIPLMHSSSPRDRDGQCFEYFRICK